ncbi:tetratricopeptide repeat protein [Streptomyces sp. NPDC008150]|uniref:serine/threonine-protein kinase n=1 Tax=Streptomyces sp. NPDC008150 TaxID=3364816 RepID=UPI0036E766B9
MAESRLIQGRYRLLDLVGRGGMGEVWRARDESLGRQVAVKCLKPLAPHHDPSFGTVLRERFRREARVAAALQHRGVTVVHDFGESDGVLHLVMEYLDGRNLSQLLDEGREPGRRAPLPVDDVAEIAEQVVAALAYTHEQGVVHRDLKPANIMRITDGTVKICDFGIARLGHDIGFTARLTGTGVAMGTPHYMSPEQIGGEEVDHRSDLYSLGCVLYEIATGAPPFDLDDTWGILVGHRDTPPRPPREHRPELPAYLERAILGLLAKEPGQRPRDAREVADRIAVGRRPPAYLPTVATAQPGSPRQELPPEAEGGAARPPSWTRGMTTGPKAVSAGPRPAPPDPAASLAAVWSGAGPVGPAAAAPAARVDAAARLAERHRAGLALGRRGRWAEARDTHGAVAAERARLLGPDHPDTLASRYEAAVALGRTGQVPDALRACADVARARERVLGADHPDTLAARQETAYALGGLGRHAEAHRVYAAVLAARERTMGPDHPDTLRCRHNLARSLSRTGRPTEAYRTAREVAAARSRLLGPGHPDTLATRYEVAYVLGQLGRWSESLRDYGEIVAARAAVLGPDHPDTLAARYEMGICLGRLGRGEQALTVYRDLAADRARTDGPTHPETLRARHGVCVNLGRLGRWDEALAESRQVYALRTSVLGPGHSDTLVSRREVAVGLGRLGRWPQALTEYRGVAAAREVALGPDHPDTLAARDDEAHCLRRLGRTAETAAPYRRAAAPSGDRRSAG